MEDSRQIRDGNDEGRLGRKFKSSSKIIPVVREQLHISKQVVETGKIHISKKVVEEQYKADIPVFKEEITVEKVQINQYIDGDLPGIRLVGDTTIIPVVKEVIVKRLLLVEEVHITKRTNEQSMPVNETVRREEVTVTRNDSVPGRGDGSN